MTKAIVFLRDTFDGAEITSVIIPGDESTPSGFTFEPAAGQFIRAADIARLASMSTVELQVRQ